MQNPFKLLSSELKYRNPWLELREDRVIRPGGKEGIFGVVTIQDGCSILAIDSKNNVWITHEFCYAVGEIRRELPSGGIEKSEDILKCAQRELLEETGLRSDDWTYLGYINPFTTTIASKNHMFIAKDVEYTGSCPEEGEIIEIEKVPFEELYKQAFRGEIKHAASVITILKAKEYLFPANFKT